METEKELNEKILHTTMLINEKHPELAEFLNEMPSTVPNEDSPEINIHNLNDYHDSLINILDHSTDNLPVHPRPDANRELDAPMLTFDFLSSIERLKKEGDWMEGKQNAITLMKSEHMRIILIAMHEGNEMKLHKTTGPISLHIIQGKLNFTAGNETVMMQKDQLLTLKENISHSIKSIEESVILLTMVNLTYGHNESKNAVAL